MTCGRLNFTGHCDGQDRGVVLDVERRCAFRPAPPKRILILHYLRKLPEVIREKIGFKGQ